MASTIVSECAVDVDRLWHIWNMNGPDLRLCCEICCFLKENQLLHELDFFLRNLPADNPQYHQNETLNRCRVQAAFWRKDIATVYKILQNNSFTGETTEMIRFWDLSHYYEEGIKRRKTLTPLARFRIRQRFLPPKSILPLGYRTKATLPKDSTAQLKEWLNDNLDNPYPKRTEKIILAEKTGLTKFQISTWFANARRRLNRKKLSPKQNQQENESPPIMAREIKPTWSPSNHQDTGLPRRYEYRAEMAVNKCLTSSYLEELQVENLQQDCIQLYGGELQSNRQVLCSSCGGTGDTLDSDKLPLREESAKNNDAAQILVNLSSTFYQ